MCFEHRVFHHWPDYWLPYSGALISSRIIIRDCLLGQVHAFNFVVIQIHFFWIEIVQEFEFFIIWLFVYFAEVV